MQNQAATTTTAPSATSQSKRQSESRVTHIYALKCPETDEVRYIGKTNQGLRERLKSHLRDKRKTHRKSWIQSLASKDMIPVIVSIEEFVDGSRDWQERERYWIAFYRASGARLLNHTDGGEGMHNPDATTRINLGNYWRGRKRPAETIEKQRQKMIGFRHTEEAKQKISESKRGSKLNLTDEQRESLRARALGRTASEDTRKKMSDAHRGKVFTEAQIEKMRAAGKLRPVSPDGIKKMRESKRRQSKDPAIRDQWTSQLGEFAKPVISRDTALMMLDMRNAGHTYMSIARHFGACNGTVRRVCLGLGPYRDLRHRAACP